MKKILIVSSIIFHLSINVYAQEFKLKKVVDGLDEPWSLSFIDTENILFTEKPGKLYSLNLKNKKKLKKILIVSSLFRPKLRKH